MKKGTKSSGCTELCFSCVLLINLQIRATGHRHCTGSFFHFHIFLKKMVKLMPEQHQDNNTDEKLQFFTQYNISCQLKRTAGND